MRATINNCKDEQILSEICSVFKQGYIQKELIESTSEARSEEEVFEILGRKYGISRKTADFIMRMTFGHFFGLNYKKVEAAYETLKSENSNADAANKLIEMQEMIHRRIDNRAKEVGLYREDDFEPIYDGISTKNASKYMNSQIRIMWVLKEPYDDEYDDGEPCGGGWNYFKCFEFNQTPWKVRTWKNMIYVTYGILNGMNMTDMYTIEERPEMADVLQQIACINMSKMPGHTTTDSSLLPKYYEIWKDILIDQIELYSPQVIIFGNTFPYFQKDLLKDSEIKPRLIDGITQLYVKDGVKYIDAYHPQCRISRNKYVDSIINCVL